MIWKKGLLASGVAPAMTETGGGNTESSLKAPLGKGRPPLFTRRRGILQEKERGVEKKVVWGGVPGVLPGAGPRARKTSFRGRLARREGIRKKRPAPLREKVILPKKTPGGNEMRGRGEKKEGQTGRKRAARG